MAFDYDVEIKKQAGKPDQVKFIGRTEPGETISVSMIERVTLSNLSLIVLKEGRGWGWQLTGQSTFRSKRLTINLENSPTNNKSLSFGTNLTLAEIAGFPNLPVLGDIKANWIVMQRDNLRVDMTIKGVGAELMLYKPEGASKYHAGFAMGDFSPTAFIPGSSNTPLKDVSFKGMVFVYNPTGAVENTTLNQLPLIFASRMPQSPNNVAIKPGLNVFGHMDVHPTGEMATLLKDVGITDLTLPLNGGFSPKAFSKNISGAAIKNAILDALDLKIPLPKLSLPGLSSVATIRKTHLTIKGVNKGGQRAVDVDVAGELDVHVAGQLVAFDFDVDVKKPAGRPAEVEIKGQTEPGTKITVNLFHPFALDSLKFSMKKEKAGWKWQVAAKTKFGSKPLDVSYVHDPGGTSFLDVQTKMTIAEIVGKSDLPGLDDVHLNWIQVYDRYWRAGIDLKGTYGYVNVFKPQGASKHLVAVTIGPPSISPDKFIPGTSNTPLKDVTFNGLSFVLAPASLAGRLDRNQLPRDIAFRLRPAAVPGNIILKSGLNVFGKVEVHPTGEMATLLKKVGITTLTLPLNGGFSPKAFAKNLSGTAIKNAILDNLDLNIKLPTPHIPEVSKFLTFKNGHLKIKGKLPDGRRGIDVGISGDADVHVKGDSVAFFIDVEYDKSGGSSELSFKGSTERKWTHPLGIKFLVLEKLTLDIKKKKKASGASTFDIKMTANTDIGSHSKLDVTVDVHEKNGKVTDAYFQLDGPLQLSEIPGVKEIPNSSHFTIDTIKISEHGIEAKTSFGGNTDLDIFLFSGSGWNLIVRQDNFALTEIVPPLKNTPLKHIVLSEAAIVLSTDGLTGPMSGFSIIAQDALKDIYGKNAAGIDVELGLSLIAAFEKKNAKGGVSGALSRLGLSQERVILTGGIGGLFGGPMKLDVQVSLSTHTGAKNQPKWMKKKPGVEAVFSLIATETDGQFDVEIGIGADINTTVHGTTLLFDAKTALVFEDEGIQVKIVADLKDKKGWRHPFGIPGFTLYEVGLDLGIDEDGAIHLGFDGSIRVSGDKYSIAADADLLPEALGAPQDIAFIASADKVDMFFMEAIAIDMIGGEFKLDIPSGILPTFTKVKFAFATPGAQDPDLHITGEGLAFKGAMNWLGHELGSMNVSVSPTKGITASGKIDNFDLGPLHLKNNDFSIKAAPTGIPSLKVDSDIVLLGVVKERFHVSFGKTGVDMSATVGAGSAAEITAELKLSGIDLSVKHPEFKKADFFVAGDIKLDVKKFIAGPAQTALNDIFNGLTLAFAAGKKAVAAAERKVNGLTSRINAERATVRREKAAAESRIRGAEYRVNGLNGRLAGQWRSYHHCHGWHKWPCRIREGIRIGWTEAELRTADWALDVARSLISHFPIDLDPRVAGLILTRDGARETLHLAEKAIEGADFLDKFLKEATAKLTEALSNAADINIKNASFKGDIRGIIKHDEPVDLAIDADLFGASIKDKFALKIKSIGEDLASDVEQLALLGLYALEHLIDRGVGSIPGPLKNKLKGALATKMDAKGAAHKRELAKYSKEFKNYNKTADAIQAANAAYNTAFLKAELAKSGKSPLDSDPTENFPDDMIEVGHTGLCLTNVGGVVKQYSCMNHADQKWATRPASGAAHTNPKGGYVFIYQRSGGLCIAPEGTWQNAPKKFDDFTFLERTFQGDGKVTVRRCVNSKEFYWKVLKHGDAWMQMANLGTGQCLHFENSSSVPGAAEAKWKPCTGAANQVFRIADSASPKIYKANISLKNDAQSTCFPTRAQARNLKFLRSIAALEQITTMASTSGVTSASSTSIPANACNRRAMRFVGHSLSELARSSITSGGIRSRCRAAGAYRTPRPKNAHLRSKLAPRCRC